MKKVLTILLLMFANFSFADQLMILSSEQRSKALKYLRENNIKDLIIFCGCCANEIPELITEVGYAGKDYGEGNKSILIRGKNKFAQSVDRELDLAYTFVNINGQASVLGVVLGFECDPCVQPFSWSDVDKRVTNNIQNPVVTPKKLSNSIRVASIMQPNTFYLNGTLRSSVGGNNRTTVAVKVPYGASSWYYTFGASKDNSEIRATTSMLAQLTRYYDPTGTTASIANSAIDAIVPPEGKSYCNVYLTDASNARLFMNGNRFSSYPSYNRVNFKSGVVNVIDLPQQEYYLCFENISSTTGIYINVEAVCEFIEKVKDETPPKTANEIKAGSYFNLGWKLHREGKCSEAMTYYNKVLELEAVPIEKTITTANIGLLQLETKEKDKAIETYISYLTMLNEINDSENRKNINNAAKADLKKLKRNDKSNTIEGIDEILTLLNQ